MLPQVVTVRPIEYEQSLLPGSSEMDYNLVNRQWLNVGTYHDKHTVRDRKMSLSTMLKQVSHRHYASLAWVSSRV